MRVVGVIVKLKIVLSVYQFLNPKYVTQVTSAGSPLTIAGSGDLLYMTAASADYWIATWVKFDVNPGSTQIFIALKRGATTVLQISKQTNGSFVASAKNTGGGTISVTIGGATTPVWTHVAALVCSGGSPKLTLVVTPWGGAALSSFSSSATPFVSFDSTGVWFLGGISPGALMTGLLLDTRFDTTCLTVAEVAVVVSEMSCHSYCPGNCFGPGEKFCRNYVQLANELVPISVNRQTFRWLSSDPIFQGYTLTSWSYAFSGWYYVTDDSNIMNLFRLQNILGEGQKQCRLMTIFLTKYSINQGEYMIDTTTNTDLHIADFHVPSSFLFKWMFMAISVCSNGRVYACYGIYPATTLICQSSIRPGTHYQWATTTDSNINVGDMYFLGIIGKQADDRFYPTECKTDNELISLYLQRVAYCGENCGTCANPFACDTCDSGYFLSGDTCSVCNACCATCTGSGLTNCSSCSSKCQFTASTTCAKCQPECDTCNGSPYPGCDTCSTGFYLQPLNAHRCYTTCPTGYSPSSNSCIGSNQVVLDFTFDKILPTVTGVNSVVALNGATTSYFPPNFETSDPLPSKQRGYFFSGTQYVQLPPASGTSGVPLMLTTTLTFTAWIRPQGSGIRTIFSKKTATDDIFTIRLSNTNRIEFIGGDPDTTYTHTQPLTSDIWIYIGIKFAFDFTTGKTTMTFYYNSIPHATTFLSSFILKDTSTTAPQKIGASALLTDFYIGFIWRVKISNFLSTDPSSDFLSPSCPVAISPCLSPCPYNQTPDCLSCLASCTLGCIRTTDCSLCTDELCDVCSDFTSTICTTCITNAINSSPCTCPPHWYFNTLNRSCDPCQPECDSCSENVYPGCDTCIAGKYMQPLNAHRCFGTCPSGYFISPNGCSGSNQTILDITFNTITATVSGIDTVIAVNGATNAYLPPAFEPSDPIPSKRRGYYFTGEQYVKLPPMSGTSGNPMILSTTLTITAWIRPQQSGLRTIFSKKTAIDELFTIRLSTDNHMEFIGGDPDTLYTHSYSLVDDVWTFVGIQFEYDVGSGDTIVTFYCDGSVLENTYIGAFVVNDDSQTAPQVIGASALLTDFFIGFIWRVKVNNYISNDPISDFSSHSCPLDLSFCLSPCPFTQNDDCSECMESCTNGCVRTTDCSLCADELCNYCSDFFDTMCDECVTNAVYSPPCTCPAHSYFNSINRSCDACQPECDTCSEAVYPGCDICAVGYYMQPMNTHRCFATCPSGYFPSVLTCVGGNGVVLDFTFDTISPTVKGVSSMIGVNGASLAYFPLLFETSDPIPSKKRGYFFAGTQYIQLPPLTGTSGNPLILTTTLTFSAWIRPQGNGLRTIYSKQDAGDRIFTIRLTNANMIEFDGGEPDTTYSHTRVLLSDIWVFVGFQCYFDVTTKTTTLTFFYDGVMHATTYTGNFVINDFGASAPQLIGASTSLTDFYFGFMWRVKISNFIATDPIADFLSPSCPVGLLFCLSPCPFSQTPECANCLSTCPYGCVRADDCGLCTQELCNYCSDFFTSDCIQCVADAINSPPCTCPSNSFYNKGGRVCQLCAAECKTCTGGSYLLCSSCYNYAELRGSECVCVDGFYPAPHSGQCTICPSICRTCSSASTCASCHSTSHLESSTCICDDGYYGLPDNCQPCGFGCASCLTYCLKCFPGYYNVGGFCTIHCPKNYEEDTTNGLCLPIQRQELTAYLTTTSETCAFLSFSSPLSIPLHPSDFAIDLTDTEGNSINFTSFLIPLNSTQYYNINLTVTLLTVSEMSVDITFHNSSNLTDMRGNPLQTSELSTTFLISSTVSIQFPTIPQHFTSETITEASLIASMSSGVLTGNFNTFFALLNNLQLLAYYPLSGVNMPMSLKGLLRALNTRSFLPNPFIYITDEGDTPPDFAQTYGFSSCNFLRNMGLMLSVGMSISLMSVLSVLLSLCPMSFFAMYFKEITAKYAWNPLVRYWIQIYLDAAIASMIQFYDISNSSLSSLFTAILGTIFTVLVLITPLFVLFVSYKYRKAIQSRELSVVKHVRTMFQEFRNDSGFRSTLYYTVFFFRRLQYAFFLSLFNTAPKLQCITFMSHSIVTLMYLFYYSPFQRRVEQVNVISGEIGTLSVFLVTFGFNYSPSERIASVLESAGTITIYGTLACGCAVTAVESIGVLVKVWNKYTANRGKAVGIIVTQKTTERGDLSASSTGRKLKNS